ncbi:hypothetical protein GCM10010240_01540 [Streptomyces griseoviridis]|nr:hypothetical protein GCM10010240_01540 [Streptomyces griseoviridis]
MTTILRAAPTACLAPVTCALSLGDGTAWQPNGRGAGAARRFTARTTGGTGAAGGADGARPVEHPQCTRVSSGGRRALITVPVPATTME